MDERAQNQDDMNANDLLRNMLDAMPIPIIFQNQNGCILYRSQEFEKLFGYTAEDVSSESDWCLHAYPDEEYRKIVDWHPKNGHFVSPL